MVIPRPAGCSVATDTGSQLGRSLCKKAQCNKCPQEDRWAPPAGPEPGEGGVTRRCQVPVAGAPGARRPRSKAGRKGHRRCAGALNGLPEVNRLLTFNLALTFLDVSGGYVKEPAEAFSAFGWVCKGPEGPGLRGGSARRRPAGHKGLGSGGGAGSAQPGTGRWACRIQG